MTTSSWDKAFKQLKDKPIALAKYIKHNSPKKRSNGQASVKCRRCGQHRGHNSKYGLDLCRQCFKQIAQHIGFKKYG
ncbi:MAG: 30S ribosomal protein S14 [Nanoarchaeota archaeon]